MNRHDAEHEHVTDTYGTFELEPKLIGMVLRINRTRDIMAPEWLERVGPIIDRWVDRWADRHGGVATDPIVGPVGFKGATSTDALAFSFLFIPCPAADWVCFSQFLTEPFRFHMPNLVPMLVRLGRTAPDGSPAAPVH